MIIKPKPLVSVIIISYKNYNYIYQAIDSVLSQNYPNIEIIISNDGSSDFKKNSVVSYIKNKSNQNIKNYIVNNNHRNLGTVKNVNKVLKLANGEYILIFAADDVMYDKKVISNFIKAFNKLPKKELIVTSQIGMYDVKLKKLLELFISPENIRKIKRLSPQKLFGELALRCIIPGSGTCYKKKIFEKYGYFEEKYKLVEDYSSSLKFTRLGIKYNFFNFISFKHRDGGISHGNVIGDNPAYNKYELDILKIMEDEVMPYLNLLNNYQKKLFKKIYRGRKWNYDYRNKYISGSKIERRQFVLENIDIIIDTVLHNIWNKFKEKSSVILFFGLLMYLTYSINFDNGKGIVSVFSVKNLLFSSIEDVNHLIGFIGLSLILLIAITKLFLHIRKIFIKIVKFYNHIF